MKCPICSEVQLVMSERQGVEIDYCPQCRGVWLDRGELDKIIEKSAVSQPYSDQSQSQSYPSAPPPQHYPHGNQRPYHKKHKSFLGEIFDFD